MVYTFSRIFGRKGRVMALIEVFEDLQWALRWIFCQFGSHICRLLAPVVDSACDHDVEKITR